MFARVWGLNVPIAKRIEPDGLIFGATSAVCMGRANLYANVCSKNKLRRWMLGRHRYPSLQRREH